MGTQVVLVHNFVAQGFKLKTVFALQPTQCMSSSNSVFFRKQDLSHNVLNAKLLSYCCHKNAWSPQYVHLFQERVVLFKMSAQNGYGVTAVKSPGFPNAVR